MPSLESRAIDEAISFAVQLFHNVPVELLSVDMDVLRKGCKYELNRTHKRALRILFNAYTSTFNELLHRANECTIHQKNLQNLMLEVYNSLTQQTPSFLWDMFYEKDNNYNLR